MNFFNELRTPNLLFMIFPLLLLLGAGCNREGKTTPPPIVAMVNGEAISLDEFNAALASVSPGEAIQASPETLRSLREEILNQLIEKKLLLQEAKLRGIEVSRREFMDEIEQMKAEYSEEAFQEYLKSEGIDREHWEKDVMDHLLVDKLMNTIMSEIPEISDEDIGSYYRTHRNDFRKKVEFRARQILVATEAEAISIRQQLMDGADFAELASEKSISPDSAAGGDLGFFSKDQMPDEFDVIFTLKINSVGPVVKSPYGFHIFKVEDKRPAHTQSLNEVKEVIRQRLLNDKEYQRRVDWIKDLKNKAYIKVNSALLIRPGESEGQL